MGVQGFQGFSSLVWKLPATPRELPEKQRILVAAHEIQQLVGMMGAAKLE